MELPAGDICTIFEKRGGYVLNCFTARTIKHPQPRNHGLVGNFMEFPTNWNHYPLVNQPSLWQITIFNGKIHYFDWAIFQFANC